MKCFIWFNPGKVDDVYNIRKVSVKFERLDRQDVATRLVIPITGAVARPHIMVRDHQFDFKWMKLNKIT